MSIGAQTEADVVWSTAAQANPIAAAASTSDRAPFAKYPALVESEIPDDDRLILDAGCGYGRVAIPLLQKKPGIRLKGVDASAGMLRYFIDLLNQHEMNDLIGDRLTLVHSTMPHLPFDENTFDDIYSRVVLLHNPYRMVEEIIGKFHHLLRPNGKLIFGWILS